MLEFKKSLTNKIIYILFLVVCFSFLLGYFLPVGIDKVKSLNQGEFLFSTYTVLTQFGFLLFSFVISYFINKDYGDKNILFYRLIDKNISSFFYGKIIILFIETFLSIFIILVIVSFIYSDFSKLFISLFLYSSVTLQYILIIGLISLFSKNILISIGISIVYWITSVILVAISKNLSFFAPFDASNNFYGMVEKMYTTSNYTLSIEVILYIVLYLFAILAIQILLMIIFKKRWINLGIKN